MIVNRLTICNIRNYVGPVEIDLSVSPDKNILLMGGLNGAGKTTFADSIRLCLYGHSIYGKVMSESKYQEFLNDFCTNTIDISEAYISMNITVDEENPPMEIDIKRFFKKTKNGFKESLSLKKGGSSVELIDENYWSYYIEKLIPPNVSRYFFFDGERVKDTIASEESTEYLQNAIKDLSGVSELENLKKDLLEVHKNILSKTKKKSDLAVIESIQGRIDYHISQIEIIDAKITAEQKILDELRTKKVDINSDLSRISGANESKKNALVDSLKELNEKYSEVDESIVDFCYNRMIYAVALSSLERTLTQAKNENKHQISRYSIEVLESILKSGSADTILKLGKKESEKAIKSLIDNIDRSTEKMQDPVLDISLSRISQMESLFVSKDELEEFLNNFETREILAHDIKNISKKIEKIEDDSLAEYADELESINEEITNHEIAISALSSEKESNEEKVQQLIKEKTLAERSIVLEDVDRAAITTIESVRESLTTRIDTVISRARVSLVKAINSMYSVLKNNEDMVKEIKLSEKYELEIYNFDDKLLKINGLSEGEKSILMYSVVYGLHSLSQLQFPLIIDSPIGRMDSIHSFNLANRLYPSVSNQLILLSHNREIVGSIHDKLRPVIAREYMITKYGSPKITPGYFD